MKKILFVCYGNTCRSPMAEALYKANMGERQDEVFSCGTGAEDGYPASPGSIKAIARFKDTSGRPLRLDNHRSRALSPRLLESADLVLTTDIGRAHSVKRFSPEEAYKVFTIGEFIGSEDQVSDPLGGTDADYRRCAEQLDTMTRLVAKRLNDIETTSLTLFENQVG
ncbi:protein-tyrosine-phosphatase [Dehalogenimonas alkenigignens]|uniref:Protein-tyrosine-phosphatase n=1 Tax=Dehalogenimonas alkenigignens TaxID=1217799 RepID=A0A0W0GK11_9CHLR|nr:low molecular weight phosphatase family protein [Dehalogenimonas alkenigignens]KTB48881.1 protein-tyrosine-phosphatase [Dehalogenimonas alkenigignens]